jgi:uncharacterized cupin superfamily protein
MSGGIAHWDEAEPRPIAGEQLRGVRGRLGPLMGAERAGLSRYDLAPGERPMPLHAHADEEEILFVLRGSGVITDGKRTWPITAGDTVVWHADGAPHTFVAGDGGLSALIFGSGSDTHLTWLPRAKAMWAATRWIPTDGPHPFALEEAAGELELPPVDMERPPFVVAFADVPVAERDFSDVRATRRRLGHAAGARRSGLMHATVAPGWHSTIPHVHSGDEELFVVLAGSGELVLHGTDAVELSRHPVRAGSLVARPAGGEVAHSFRAGDDGLELLCYSSDDRNDLCFYPRSRKLAANAFGLTFRVDPLPYADGEPARDA